MHLKVKGKIGPYIFWTLGFLAIPLWLLFSHEAIYGIKREPLLILCSEISALLGLALFALTFILSTRIKWLEDSFGGLDKMYQTHHKLGKTAFFLLLAHPIFLAIRWIPGNIEKLTWYFFPVHRRLAVNLGSYAWWGLILLMLLTLVIKIPYDKWKITHKFLGIFFILGVLHAFLLESNITTNVILLFYFSLISLLAIAAYVYKTILFDAIIKHYNYKVTKVSRLSDKIIEIIMLPEKEKLKFFPGQYYFFSFFNPLIKKETHPFTICSPPKDNKIHICVKTLGDFTKRLYEDIKPGIQVRLEGPYGRFDFTKGKNKQIWIAGGVGIAPFLSWARYLKNHEQSNLIIDLYYCVNSRDEALFYDEFKSLCNKYKGFNLHLISADTEGFLNTEQIDVVDRDIFICGPKAMRKKLIHDFLKQNVSKKNIQYEDFVF